MEYFAFRSRVDNVAYSSDHSVGTEYRPEDLDGDGVDEMVCRIDFGGIVFVGGDLSTTQLMEIFLDVSSGGMFTKDLIKFLSNAASNLDRTVVSTYVRVYQEKLRDEDVQNSIGMIMPNLAHYAYAAEPRVMEQSGGSFDIGGGLEFISPTMPYGSSEDAQFVLTGKRPLTLRGTIRNGGAADIAYQGEDPQTLDSCAISMSEMCFPSDYDVDTLRDADTEAEYLAAACHNIRDDMGLAVDISGTGLSLNAEDPRDSSTMIISGRPPLTSGDIYGHNIRVEVTADDLRLNGYASSAGGGSPPTGGSIIADIESILTEFITTREEIETLVRTTTNPANMGEGETVDEFTQEGIARLEGHNYIIDTFWGANKDIIVAGILRDITYKVTSFYDEIAASFSMTPISPSPDPEASEFKVNGCIEDPNKLINPGLSVLIMPHLMFNPCMRHCAQAALFSAGVPTTEMSLCAPYLNLSFYNNTPALENVSSAAGGASASTRGNMISFLGTGNVNIGTADYEIANSDHSESTSTRGTITVPTFLQDEPEKETSLSMQTRTGMEMFTSPQTLVNMDINSERRGSSRVLDPTQPLMTLQSVSVREYASGYGLIGFKKATVTITLHDRTRLGEVSHFIAPSAFGRVNAFLEFGWSHPNGDILTGSPYGAFLNSLRSVEKYRLIKGNYDMDASGQVKITLEMGTMGGEESKITHVSTSNNWVHVSLINSAIRDITSEILRLTTDGPISEEIRDVQRLSTRGSDSQQLIQRAIYDDLRGLLNTITSASSVSENVIQGVLSRLLYVIESTVEGESAASSSFPAHYTNTVASEVGFQIRNLCPSTSTTDDPFITNLFPLAMSAAEAETEAGQQYAEIRNSLSFATMASGESLEMASEATVMSGIDDITAAMWEATQESEEEEDEDTELTPEERQEIADQEYNFMNPETPGEGDWVSLGKVMSCLVAAPLAATGRYDEVQLCFYNFNDSAGACQGKPISVFPIRSTVLAQEIADAVETNANLTTSRMEAILGRHVNNGGAQAYGFKDLHRTSRDNRQARMEAMEARREAQRQAEGEDTRAPDSQEPITPAEFNLSEAHVERMCALGMYRPEFKIPRLKIIYEAVPVIVYDDPPFQTSPIAAMGGGGFVRSGDRIEQKQLVEGKVDRGKTLLRIHVIDQNAQAHPGEQLVIDTLEAGSAVSLFSNFTGGTDSAASNIASALSAVEDDIPLVRDQIVTNASTAGDSLRILAANTTRQSIHNYVKSKVPTIQFGTAFSPFSSVTISGMSSGAIFDALLSETFRENDDPSDNSQSSHGADEVTVVPVTAKVSGLGNPMFHYGQQFYLDLKTGTTADNIFTVRSVTHNISAGKFTTDIDFSPAGTQGTVSSVRTNIIQALATIDKLGGSDNGSRDPINEARAPLLEELGDALQSDVEAFANSVGRVSDLRKSNSSGRRTRRSARRDVRRMEAEDRRQLRIDRRDMREMTGELDRLYAEYSEVEEQYFLDIENPALRAELERIQDEIDNVNPEVPPVDTGGTMSGENDSELWDHEGQGSGSGL